MKNRGVKKVIHSDILDVSNTRFDTLLMLMNGIGMVGKPKKLDQFLIKSKQLLNEKGIILFDSIDVSKTETPNHVVYREKNILNHRLPGE